MAAEKNHRVKDIDTLKALGHPLRIKLYRALFMAGTATASQLADKVDEPVSLVSYHLRKLSAHRIIEEAEPGSGDGRERWWRPVSTTISTRDEDWREAPERAAVHAAVSRVYARQRYEMYEEHLDTRDTWSDDWRGVSFSSEYLFTLTAEELQELGRELDELVAKWRERGTAAREAGETQGRENVVLHVNGFPFRT
ncbi:helix-turn-helix transcriptional regulator [Nonomuraea sp. KC401]|uniref:winged helix-turn-helix domain-containing protein n=1 Tax=unclassified Nonomuraea TaxID=2593643 RepID=UPI0010FE6C10|nr:MULTISPECIES: helix-turn-helix domain-containing protein [unclassified Nonomuraea]NBE96659.1 helix-turn-helix domain-containing protein [Nonomuraea sp. K271]TLF67978.1 helix-turn-helix transcriptional regulator [Nonomuraea sp. KC401]